MSLLNSVAIVCIEALRCECWSSIDIITYLFVISTIVLAKIKIVQIQINFLLPFFAITSPRVDLLVYGENYAKESYYVTSSVYRELYDHKLSKTDIVIAKPSVSPQIVSKSRQTIIILFFH